MTAGHAARRGPRRLPGGLGCSRDAHERVSTGRHRGSLAGAARRAEFRSSRRLGGMETTRAVTAGRKVTFCRICEAHCGMVATVEDERVVKLRPDPDHALSRGYACPKGIAMLDVQNDPDRVTHPLRKRARRRPSSACPGTTALDDIGARLSAILDRHGPAALGWYMGNPAAFSYSHTLWVKGFLDARRHAALLDRVLAGRRQPLRRQRAALRLARGDPHPRPAAHGLPAHARAPTRWSRTGRCSPRRACATSSTRSSAAAGAWSSSTRGAPRPRARSSTWPSARTATPGCCSRSCT